jgi:hypothetical protein
VEIDGNGSEIGSPVVLKDIWINSDRTREGNILASLRATANGEDKELFGRHFLTTICHGDVWTELDILDDTANTLMRGLNIALDHDSLLKSERNPFIQHYGSESRVIYAHKTHYRIVFKERGVTIDRIKSLPAVMTILSETATGAFLYRMVHL